MNNLKRETIQGSIPTDMAICDECIKETQDKINRRYMYPDCGPKLILLDGKGRTIDSIHPIATARQLLREGKLIGIKGIGGYHIACNACDENAIDLLRKRKIRPDKPLAIMAVNLEAAKLICKITDKEEEILTSRQKPIVLLEKQFSELLPHNIAPRINRLGVMLPYTPLHHLLFHAELQFLIMTSGNVSGMPICYKDDEVFEKLKDVVDSFLVHDREILTPIDDSVVRVIGEKEMVSRSARGYFPYTIQIDSDKEIMAVGAEQKSSLCLLHKGYAHLTQYLGNLDEMNAYEEYFKEMKRMKILLGAEPKIIAHDLHTGYLSTQWAITQPTERIPIQHHHAHMAACIAEHNLKQDVIGIIYDGTGLGIDGAIWGGEFLIGSKANFSRVGHWKYVTLQGGDSAIKEPWKLAASYLYAMGINSEEFLNSINSLRVKVIQNAIKNNINCFQSSSIGRLFDCVSALVMKRTHITYDAQAAIELESVIEPSVTDFYSYSIDEKEEKLIIEYEEIILGILKDMNDGKTASYISAKFHNTVCEATIDCVCKIRRKCGIDNIVLGGGVFENIYLLKKMKQGLKERGFNTYHNMKIPTNDGGIAFGQLVVAAQRVKEGNYVSGSSGKDCNY